MWRINLKDRSFLRPPLRKSMRSLIGAVAASLLGLLFAGTLATCSKDSTAPRVSESLFVPANAQTVEGSSANQSPFKVQPGRFQTVYAQSVLTLPVGAKITAIRFRLDGPSSPLPTVTIDNFEIRLSTSKNPPGSLSPTFANNRGTDEVVVRTGPLSIASADYPTGGSPNLFGPLIQFSQPFVYRGGPMLLEIGATGMPAGSNRPSDAVFPATVSQSGYGTSAGFNATTADLGMFDDLIVVEYRFERP